MMLASYLMFLWALVVAAGDETTFAGGILGVGLGLVPAVFAVAAWVSQHPHALGATLAACGFWLLVVVPLGIFNLPLGLVAGFGVGGIAAFRLGPHADRKSRFVAIGLTVLYTLALQVLFPAIALFGSAPLTFIAIALADTYRERYV
jgi:hypothetical protein